MIKNLFPKQKIWSIPLFATHESCQPTGQRLSGGVVLNGTEQLRESSIFPFTQTLSAGLISPLDNTRTPGYDKKAAATQC